MMLRFFLLLSLCLLSTLVSAGCDNGFGKVDQGRVIEFDKRKRTITIIRDVSADPRNPSYTRLPPVTFELPQDPDEMGEEPKAGYCMKLDAAKNQITIFDPAAQGFKTIEYKPIYQKERVERDDELVFDKHADKARKFPVIDRSGKTITVYSSGQKILMTFLVPDQYCALPEKTWDTGDEVRIYYREEGKALRFMNISRTNIFNK
jgi:hypothetical protein